MATFTYPTKTKTKTLARTSDKSDLNSTQNLVDPEWEVIDPTPDVHILFTTFNGKFFAGKLSCVELEWSKKMYQCAGICYSRRNRMGMACVIRLSEPLLKLRSRKDLVETLLHEMIHAWNFIRGITEENGGHGQNFLAKMNEINRVAGTNISVYHTFRDEVDLYKTHWWRCDGVCQNRGPFYGFVKRTCNRAPGKNDRWWQQHEQSCGGKFIKVKEPEKKVKSKENKPAAKKPKISPKASPKASPGADIRKFFKPEETPKKSPEKSGHVLGGQGNGRSRLLDMFQKKKTEDKKRKLDEATGSDETIVLDDVFSSFHDRTKFDFDDDDEIIFIDDEFDDKLSQPPLEQKPKIEEKSLKVNCPVCNVEVEIEKVNEHLDSCLC